MVQYSNERLLEALRECKQKHGKITTQALNNDDDLPSGPIYSYRFNSFSDAAKRAGLDEEAKRIQKNKKKRIGYSDKEIKEFLHSISDSDNTVSTKMIRQGDGPSEATIRNHINADSLVGESVDGVEIVSQREYNKPDKEQVDSELQRIAADKDTVTVKDLHSSDISRSNLYTYYDSIQDARESLDISHPNKKGLSSIEQPHKYVYVIRIDDEIYVGKSETPLQRIQQHNKNGRIALEKIIKVPEDREALDYEREVAMEMAREYETTNINGGR